jgi:predicted PurR-regulated permease PerM
VGLKFGIVIGMITGLLVIVPYAGFALGFIMGMVVALFQFDSYQPILMVVGVYMIGQALESYFLTPKLVGEQVGLHPVWIIFGMLAGGALFGFVGVLIAVPVTAILGVLIRFMTEQYLKSDYYKGGPVRVK